MSDQICNCRPRWEGHECTVFTAAEQALSDSVHGDNEVTVLYDRDVKDAIAAVRGPLYREVAEVLDKLAGIAPLHTLDGLIYATNHLAEMAHQAEEPSDV